ncbi:hypothetical protein L291_3210 [Acinetobacter guillouiae MSP4-18]|uniref:AAA family ATPase n=1 Tax=Acinetobacter guillouiae TaxID=106649 RepID=UPI0002D06CB9|nr:AAA family ATPase [Acinetobacter guillouiae]ENU56881.1 hypothetical protein F981_04016 [Acinetobacter guillouiae CIP 63.46]EPH32551.1 hypothetical protein L291_3210 [Acinetobacter guillouiae MSP4-18]KAB0623940.1 AAA family ATPase [Acinetobacter guillouiae]
MKFKSIQLSEWQQFKKIQITFHPKVTIITGANGSGKSTILKLLSKHFGWYLPFLGTPYLVKDQGVFKYKSIFRPLITYTFGSIQADHTLNQTLGFIYYSNNKSSTINIQNQNVDHPQYEINFSMMQIVDGLHINSHRPMPKYEQVQNIPTNPMDAHNAYERYSSVTKELLSNNYVSFSPTYRMKEAIISMAAFGPGNRFVQPNEKIENIFSGFKDILRRVLPKELGFKDLSIRVPDIVLVTETGEFVLDACSGGIMSIIDLAWQIFLYAHDKKEFVITIDEPENHLHPSMQRSLLNDFVEAFPNGQFIVVTHSPFVVSSIKDSHVYALKYEDFNDLEKPEKIVKKVVAHKLDLNQKAATAHEILKEVLGVPVTLPQWAEQDLQRICSNFTQHDVTKAGLAQLRSELHQAGLGEFYSQALNNIVESNFHD